MLNILIISDETEGAYEVLKSSGFFSETPPADESDPLFEKTLKHKSYDIALLDIDNERWEEKLLFLRHYMPVIVFSKPDLRKAVTAIKLGATDYIEKPLNEKVLEDLINQYKKKILEHDSGLGEIIGTSPSMQEVFAIIRKAAQSDSNVLITGESGTGKELVAKAIHRMSKRSEGPFITINCGAIPDTLLESELFGFEKGAFTGANYTKKGLLELADGGTVFFDEIGDVSQMFQVKILRFLQEGEFFRIGGMRPVRVDLRIISATNKDLQMACKKGNFREDLFYRLNVINIHLPPLKDRKEDIPLLVRHFLQKHGKKRSDILIKDISDDAMNILKNYSYPGNIRELENIIERAISFANSPMILPSDLPAYLLRDTNDTNRQRTKLRDALLQVKRDLIVNALRESGGNISRAASMLGIYRQQLQRLIKILKIAT